MALIGYARVSTDDQHPEAQTIRLREAGCEKVFVDHGVSGKLASRPELDACLGYVREGDTLVIVKLDRLGRSVRHLIDQVEQLHRIGVDLRALDQAIDTRTPTGKMLFHILAAVAEFERDLLIERTRDGLNAAKARGRTGGRRPVLTPEKLSIAMQQVAAGKMTMEQIAKAVGVSRATLYRHLDEKVGA